MNVLIRWSTIGSFVFGQGPRFVTTPSFRFLFSDCREFCVWAGNEVLYDRILDAPSLRLCPCLWNRTVTEEGGFPAHEGVQRPGRFSTLGIVHPNGFVRSADRTCLKISNGHAAVGSPALPTFRHCWCNATTTTATSTTNGHELFLILSSKEVIVAR